MKRLRSSVPASAIVLAAAAFALSGADAKPKHKHHVYVAPETRRAVDFPVYIDHGSDRNPGMDNLYFTDTRSPSYELGPTIFQKYEDK